MTSYPEIEVVLSVGTWDTALDAYADTGFEGGIAIPRGLAREIASEPQRVPLRLADGEVGMYPTWRGTVEIDGRQFRCEVASLRGSTLLGREVLDQLSITFDFGRTVLLRFRDESE